MKRENKQKVSLFSRFLNGVETIGNRLPHPITMFAIFTLAIVLLSAVLSALGLSAEGEMIDSATKKMTSQIIRPVNLLSRDGLAYMLTHIVSNFTGFAPLGVVLVTMLGVGCAEGSGYLSALIRKAVSVTPKAIVTPAIIFLGVMSNVASDVGYVVLIPIGALIFSAYGKHPIAGIAAAFAGVSGGFSANLLIGTIDPMLAGLSTEAAHMIEPGYTVHATANWYFMIISTFLIVLIGTWVTDKIIEPRLSRNDPAHNHETAIDALSARELKALKYANLSLGLLILLFILIALPQNSFLRNPETGSLINQSPLINGLIVIISLLFFIPSIIYGRICGTYKDERDICAQLQANMTSMGAYLALAFIAAQFISFFNYTKLGTIVALKGSHLIETLGLPGPVLMILFILLVAAINLIMGSASAKWSILAPVFVPMFMLLGYSPELTQVAYRIGDSCTNLITPLMTYFTMIVVFAKKYDKDAGIGTLISTMLPYSFFFLAGWTILLIIWMTAGWPLGV